MSVLQPTVVRTTPAPALRAARTLAWLVPLGLLGAMLAFVLVGHPPPGLRIVIAGGIALIGLLALTIFRYDTAVFLGFMLLSVVWIQPGPPDVVFAVVFAVAAATGKLRLQRLPLSVGILVAGFVFLNLLSAAFVVDPPVAERYFAITLYLAIFSFWLADYVDSASRARRLLLALLITGGITAAGSSLALYIPGFPLANTLTGAQRAKGLFHDPNIYGPFMVVLALFVLEEILQPRLLRLRPVSKFALLLIFGSGVLFSFSRAAWLNAAVAVFAMLVVFSLRHGGGQKAMAILVTMMAALAALAIFVSVSGSATFLSDRARLQSYDTSRFSAQETGLKLVAAYPFGVGPGQFESYVPVSAHSTYIRALAEQGVLGLVTILSLIMVTLVLAGRNAVLGRDTFGLGSAALLGAWCGLVANSAFVDTLHWRHFWLLAALIWAGSMQPRRNRQLS
jgi:O-antigen ligase/polysaccharide polymerase Wzy-like membrane protein